MIRQTHKTTDSISEAVWSPCRSYRYALTRRWGDGAGLGIVMLNPSTADAFRNDPTVERCERRARALGYGAFRVVNLFAFCATDPRDLRQAAQPVGPDNDSFLLEAAGWADAILCGWGVHGAHQGRHMQVEQLLRGAGASLFHLGLTKDGLPRHPLYVAYRQGPEKWH
ncbi:DUF1643 domain-containing protein [Paracoccus sp. JM45]|uniref:DUF1643 domain-containing protein n=1 Tax=Paracoccus sp. JM45 TaxID=2283626 RepID=UPI000E6BA13F|nr:DUF1643 domain-containing protein [Paracoccus sp. JM45]RJE79306.1 DUF1643 domain-containing protein [Paracoccus sp. JM45]